MRPAVNKAKRSDSQKTNNDGRSRCSDALWKIKRQQDAHSMGQSRKDEGERTIECAPVGVLRRAGTIRMKRVRYGLDQKYLRRTATGAAVALIRPSLLFGNRKDEDSM